MENQPEVHNDYLNGSQASGSIDRRTYSYDDDKRLHKVSFFFFRFLSARAFPLTGVLTVGLASKNDSVGAPSRLSCLREVFSL